MSRLSSPLAALRVIIGLLLVSTVQILTVSAAPLTAKDCYYCWGRGKMLAGSYECNCQCDIPSQRIPSNSSSEFFREVQIDGVEVGGATKLELLGPTCHYTSAERKIFNAYFKVGMAKVDRFTFAKRVIRYLSLKHGDQFGFHSLGPSPRDPAHSIMKFDIRDTGFDNNISSNLLAADRTVFDFYQFQLVQQRVEIVAKATNPALLAIEVHEDPLSPAYDHKKLGSIEGFSFYLGTGSFFLGTILFTCLLCMLEAACTTNVAGDHTTMREWMAHREQGLPDGDGNKPDIMGYYPSLMHYSNIEGRQYCYVNGERLGGDFGGGDDDVDEAPQKKSGWDKLKAHKGKGLASKLKGQISSDSTDSPREAWAEEDEEYEDPDAVAKRKASMVRRRSSVHQANAFGHSVVSIEEADQDCEDEEEEYDYASPPPPRQKSNLKSPEPNPTSPPDPPPPMERRKSIAAGKYFMEEEESPGPAPAAPAAPSPDPVEPARNAKKSEIGMQRHASKWSSARAMIKHESKVGSKYLI